jgi:hypothetical protein
MSRILYNNDDLEDVTNVYSFINSFTLNLGIKNAETGPGIVERIVKGCKHDFPHSGGIDKASAFKQVANFACYFIAEKPVLEAFPSSIIGQLSRIDNHQNAMLAFAIAEEALNNSTIEKDDGNIVVANRIQYSLHSYIDIIDALSSITPTTHFKLLTVFFEQLVYKTNPECQYDLIH